MESVTYIISLDAIDLNLLYNTYKPRHNITTLWSINCKDLCEFQIHIQESSAKQQCLKNESTKERKKMESIICHVCNTYVPKQFLGEHNKSLKHKIYMEIANTAVKRIREQINYENNNETIELNESVYFCSHCVSVINIKEKKQHEGSLNHKNSVFLDNQMLHFLNLYSINIEKIDDNKYNDNNAWHNQRPSQKYEEEEDNDSETVDEGSYEMKASKETSKQIKLEDALRGLDLISYLNILKDKHKMTLNVNVIDKSWLEIEIEGSKIEVASDHFHGLKENSSISSSIECVVCSEIVNYEDIVAHMMGAKHMYRVSRPMQDKHCNREICPLRRHCVLCNIIIADYNLHTISDVHIIQLKEAVKSDGAKYTDNSIVSSKNDNLLSKTDSNQTDVTTQLLSNVESKYTYLFKIEMGSLWCIVCDVAINETDGIETHINLEDHRIKYIQLLITNKLQIQCNNERFCGVCNAVVINSQELLHINDSCHKQNLQDSENNKNQSKTKSYYCDICGVNVPNNENNIQLHNQGRLHLNKNIGLSTKSLSYTKKKFWNMDKKNKKRK